MSLSIWTRELALARDAADPAADARPGDRRGEARRIAWPRSWLAATFIDGVRTRVLAGAAILAGLMVAGCPVEPEPTGLRPTTWRTAVETGPDQGAFLSVWGPSSDEVWAVGGQVASIMDTGRGLAYRRRGGQWSPVTLPVDTPLLNWVHGTESRVWIVGNAGAALFRGEGEDWTVSPTGASVPLWGCWVVDDDDVWAVGGDAFDDQTPPVIVHWDGRGWTEQVLPALDRPASAMFKVWAAGADDVWVVGDAGVILHYDGRSWEQQLSGTGNDLISLWGTGADQIVAVGGRSTGTISRYDGVAWTTEEVGRIAGLNGVWMDPGGDAALAGNLGAAGVLYDPGFETELGDSGAGVLVLHGIYGVDRQARFAVGGSLDRSPPYVGVILETD